MVHQRIYKPCEQCGESFTMKGKQTVARQKMARFCSVACRSAAGRRDVVCENCGTIFNLKANLAKDRHFCSRKCMFAAWGCTVCSKIRPEERRAVADRFCSDRCSLTLQLEQLKDETGESLAPCRVCRRILPEEQFTRERKNRNGLSNECKECSRSYYEQNKDAYRRRRYGYQASPGGILIEFTPAQKAARFAMWGGRCWMCGIAGATEDDHVKPISRGGSHCLSNLRPICKPCNNSKGAAWPLVSAKLRANFAHPAPRDGWAGDEVTPREPRRTWSCPQCRETSLVRAHVARTQKFCSRECAIAAREAKTLEKTCLNVLCGKTFMVPDQKGARGRKFCSIDCAWVARDRPAHWKGVSEGQTALF
ncbi:5-methylcytosine-specific restriction endonuclease McrA/endogenous inhibitor of DNA gyrase (YacG/DUF329 family) [Arthrobacter ulcerisalmonis]|nr:HNH endonuclease signature motif containing protein [Arthrobacter ulcerisalmonis]MDQ0664738.1 5-methylcytosine-specific restriction endonuclease McrA/endogenous inhibitor of DNA gyrase (YacG/DUF329 family) [Arthrobacter ulcerisalmonis]